MKKALPVILVLAALAVAIAVFLKRKGDNLGIPPGLAAELAPADAIVLLEIPDPERTRQRWKDTNLHKLSQEPEWQEFTAKWGDFIRDDAVFRELGGVFGDLQRADPAGLYLALTSLEGNTPKIVGGFPYRGKRSEVESTAKKLKEKVSRSYPAAKSELTTYEGIEVETLKDPKFTAAIAYRDNWVFFATDTDLLLKTLSRSMKKPDAPASLAKDPLWVESTRQDSADPDFRLWAKWSVFADKLGGLAPAGGAGGPAPGKDPNPIQAISYSWKLDGPLMRDRMYFHMAGLPKAEPLANRSLGFTQPATIAYLAFNLAGHEERGKALMYPLAAAGVANELVANLASKGLKLEDVFTVFGPEIAIMSAWEEGGIALPDAFAAVEVRDKEKARGFAEAFAEQLKKQGEVLQRTEGETTIWTLSAKVPYLKPSVAVNGTHLMFGLNPTALDTGMKQLAEKRPNLATKPDSQYAATLKTVIPPTGTLVYIDTKALFERLYDKVKPMIAFSLVGNPDVGKYFDAAKLPQATTISRHLAPMVVSQGTAGTGLLMEGTGSVSLMSFYMVTTHVTALLGVRAFEKLPDHGSPTAPTGVPEVSPKKGGAPDPEPTGDSPKPLRPSAPGPQ